MTEKTNMKIDVIILAGGVGSRMGGSTPKQFIEINGVPIIVTTLLNFEKNKRISNITIVCLKDFIPKMKELVEQYKINKVNNIVEGGQTGHDSARNGVFSLKDKLGENDFVIIHDAVRPILPQVTLNEMIDVALAKGNACLAVPCYETVICTNDGISGDKEIDRNSFVRVQTPQMYKYGLIKDLYEKAEKDNIHNFIYANTMAIHYGVRIYFSKGFNSNYKITTKQDIPLYEALSSFSDEELAKR